MNRLTAPDRTRRWNTANLVAGLATVITATLAVALAGPATAATAAPGTWTDTATAPVPRYNHSAVRLTDGRVLVTGGLQQSIISGGWVRTAVLGGTQIYDPVTDRWTSTRTLATPRYDASAVTLTDGRVLIAGGFNGAAGGEQKTTELYTPRTGKWTAGPTMTYQRTDNLAIRLADGRVLIAGQKNVAVEGDAVPTGELFNPSTNTWTATGPTGVSSGAGSPQAALLPDGRVITTLGMSSLSSGPITGPDIYTPSTNTWSRLPAPPIALGNGVKIALLPNGHVLFAGGWFDGYGLPPTNDVAELDPITGTWTVRPPAGAILTALANGKVLASGVDAGTDQLYDPSTATWTVVEGSGTAAFGRTVTALTDGRALAVGGDQGTPTVPIGKLFQP